MTADVTVVIPAYNPGAELRDAVASVLAQSATDLECLVIDDASTAPLPDLPDDPRLRLIRAPANLDVARARNLAVALSDSPLIAFLDQDDRWAPTKLQRQLEQLAATPDAAFCYTEFHWQFPDGSRVVSDADGRGRLTYAGLLADGICLPGSLLVRRADFITVGGFNPDIPGADDHDFALKLLALDRPVAHVPTPEWTYVVHDANRSLAQYRQMYHRMLAVKLAHRELAVDRDDQQVVAACDRGIARVTELAAFQSVDAARIAYRGRHFRRTADHLAFGARAAPRVVARSLGQALRTRLQPPT